MFLLKFPVISTEVFTEVYRVLWFFALFYSSIKITILLISPDTKAKGNTRACKEL